MKKITSRETFTFNAGNDEVLDISPEGTLASDGAAALALARYGGLVIIEDVNIVAEVDKIKGGADADVEVSASMGRDALEAVAIAKGIDTDTIAAAKTKADLAAIINNFKQEAAESTPEGGGDAPVLSGGTA